MVVRRVIRNYEEPDGPFFTGAYAPPAPVYVESLTAVSYNIQFAAKIQEAIGDLSAAPANDIILLQEMDETGTDQIAKALKYDYVYFPASIHHKHERNFGNAILSKWPISTTKKLVLPRRNPANGQIRIAVKGVIDVAGTAVTAYSVHTEVYLSTRSHRREQGQAIAKDLEEAGENVIVGGDFNTVRNSNIKRITNLFAQIGFVRASKGVGPTIVKYKLSPSAADHIFTRGMKVIAAGRVKSATASDHYPIWAKVSLSKL